MILRNLTTYTTKKTISTCLQSLLSHVSSCTSLSSCQAIHAIVTKSQFLNEGFIGDRLVSLYVRTGQNCDAHKLFDEIPERDLVSWNSFISALSRKGMLALCLDVFYRMRVEAGVVNEVTLMSMVSGFTDHGALHGGRCFHGFVAKYGYMGEVKVVNALINMYGKLGLFDAAYDLFHEMEMPNLVSWNSLLALHSQRGFSNEVLRLFSSMRRAGIEPDQATMVSLVQGCSELSIAKHARVIHGYVFKCGFDSDMLVMTSLMSLYAKSGLLSAAQNVFGELKNPDRVAWTAMLASYAVHGQGWEAIEIFEKMVKSGVYPDHVTFTHLLSACSHAGLVSEGRKFFEEMYSVYGIQPRVDHYSCMVDLLGRYGLLEDAYGVIKHMKIEPNAGVWGALLGACRIHRNMELGKEVAERLLLLDSSDSRNYIMLSNIYSASGQWGDASTIRTLMKKRPVVRNPGYSLIEHGNRVYRFIVDDQSHPDSDKIHAKLDELIRKIRETGLAPQTEFVLHDVEEDVKADMINKHSEKLALAFGLLVTIKNMPITIIKNIRICGDCHSVMKLASLIEKRTIIVRDPKRFHHFVNGMCSCKDYW